MVVVGAMLVVVDVEVEEVDVGPLGGFGVHQRGSTEITLGSGAPSGLSGCPGVVSNAGGADTPVGAARQRGRRRRGGRRILHWSASREHDDDENEYGRNPGTPAHPTIIGARACVTQVNGVETAATVPATLPS